MEKTQQYTHAIAISFRTIYVTKYATRITRTNNIIDFSAVLMSMSTGEIEADFNFLVHPMDPLAEIDEKHIKNSYTLRTVMLEFKQWLISELGKRNLRLPMKKEDNAANCIFITQNRSYCRNLQKEILRRAIPFPIILGHWYVLETAYYASFSKVYKLKFWKLVCGSEEVLCEELRPEEEDLTNKHSSKEHCRRVARWTFESVCDGIPLYVTDTIIPHGVGVDWFA